MMRALIVLFMVVMFSPSAMASGVVVSIKPLHSLVAAVMKGDENQPEVLLSGGQSLHSFSLKPSQAKMLADADLVFYISDEFELFMDKALDGAPRRLQRIALSKVSGLTLLPSRMGRGFEPHEHHHEHGHEHETQERHDLHLWMSPANAKVMVQEIARQLSVAYPQKKVLYMHNAELLVGKLDALDASLAARMEKLKGRPFVVFHDAYQYFEQRYGLRAAGSLTVHPERGLSAGHLADLRAKIASAQAVCVFREPQFDGAVIDNLLAGTGAKSAALDPEGALLAPSEALYFEMMEAIAAGFESCLAA
ncbi:MAG: zinc ABC transporter substrate-binding protein [Alphaproteobacteria bacterium]|nr:zinc ABC transporter substrate-binding protein [Alphaproteobacteria bacterium]